MIQVMKPVRLILGVLLLATACTKDPGSTIQPPLPAPVNVISRLEKDGEVLQTTYNTDSTIHTLLRKLADGTVLNNYVFSYANGKLVEINFSGKWKYYYTGDLITAVETANSQGVVRYRTEFTYANGKIIEKTGYLSTAGVSNKPSQKIQYTYDLNGNIATEVYFDYVNDDWMKTDEHRFIEYDTKPNTKEHLENFPYMPLHYFSVNNPLRENYINDNGQPYGLVMHAYQYDSNGRPTTRKSTYSYKGFPDTYSDAAFYY